MTSQKTQSIVVRVHAGPYRREGCPVELAVPWPSEALIQLQRQGIRRPEPCQLFRRRGQTYVCWLVDRLRAGASATYILTCGGRRRRAKARVRTDRLGPTRLHTVTQRRQIGVLRLERGWFCPFWSPLRTPTGHSITAEPSPGELLKGPAAPPTGLWIAPPYAAATNAVEVELMAPVAWSNGPVFSVVELLQRWSWGAEALECRVRYKLYAATARWWLLDVEAMFVGRYGRVQLERSEAHAVLNLRLVPALWLAHAARLQTPLGPLEPAALSRCALPWVDLSGLSGGRWIGVMIMLPPKACAHEPWFVGTHGTVTVGGWGKGRWVELAPGQQHVFRARLCIHAGDAGRIGCNERYADYGFPPQMEILEGTDHTG